jgi:hypothetical protein
VETEDYTEPGGGSEKPFTPKDTKEEHEGASEEEEE